MHKQISPNKSKLSKVLWLHLYNWASYSWPSLPSLRSFDASALRCSRISSGQADNVDTVHLSDWGRHSEQVGRCAGMQEKPDLFQALRHGSEGFLVIPFVIFTPASPPPPDSRSVHEGPEPTLSSNKPPGSESNVLMRKKLGWGGLHHANQHSEISRGQVLPHQSCGVALQILVNHWLESRTPAPASSGPSQLGSLSAAQTLKGHLNVRLQQCAHSMTSLFVKIDYFK